MTFYILQFDIYFQPLPIRVKYLMEDVTYQLLHIESLKIKQQQYKYLQDLKQVLTSYSYHFYHSSTLELS